MSSYENYPAWIVILTTLASLSIYAIGFYILSVLNLIVALLYIIYIIYIELRVLRKSCVNCYYYGKMCGFGRGKICSQIFGKGDPKKFVSDDVTWINILPDFMVFIIPVVGAIILLVGNFSWLILILMAVLIFLSTIGNGIIRGSLTCKFCKQREIGCPAEKLFRNKENTDAGN